MSSDGAQPHRRLNRASDESGRSIRSAPAAQGGSASARAWPAFGAEQVDWVPNDSDYGPRSHRKRYRGPYTAALPAAIARAELRLPPETVTLVGEASTEIARFDGEALSATASYAALLLRTEAASSSQIEDLTSSAKAIALAELGRRGRDNADQIVGNVSAMTRALDSADRLGTGAILEMHRMLTEHNLVGEAGMLRTELVWIGGSSRGPHDADYVAPRHELVPAAMDDLAEFMVRDDLAVLAQSAVAHAQFENIHPFTDGNGRTGRALLHAMLRHGGLVTRSIIPVSAGLLGRLESYFAALEAYRGGDPVPIITAVAESVFPALANSRELIDEITSVRASWNDRIAARRDASAWRLAELLTTRPVIDSKFVASELGVTTANAQIAIDRLVEDGVVTQIGHGHRDRVWQSSEVLDAMEAFAARVRRRV